ncbi:MAG: outer membrane adhesin-like protein [Halomonas sp. 54_146]|nr:MULTISPECIES: DUF4214 domain-containing protein [unclassified Halomonas]KUJ89222.1 MAG: outer membrane adhesin-like protein [Halomonas sp. 54_146]HAA46070.1 hypothetical protein [Halomonas sp.]
MATQENLDRVQQLYVAYYGRPADQEGQEYWADRLEAEGEGAIINAFGNSEEYAALAEGQGNGTLINNIYLQAFGRGADPEGLAYYAGVLERGEKSLAEIATTIINAAGGSDKEAFDVRVEAAAAYTAESGAAADYDIVAAKDAIEAGVNAKDLTAALEAYKTALDEKEAFLEEGEFANDAAVGQELTDAESAVTSSNLETQNVISAKIVDAQETKAVAEAAIAEVDGLKAVVDAYLASETNLENAQKAASDAAAELAGEETTFEARGKANNTLEITEANTTPAPGTIKLALQGDATSSTTFVIYNQADVNSKWVLNKTALESAQTFASNNGVEGLDALVAELQASLAADDAEAAAQTARNSALDDLLDAEDAADATVDNSNVNVDANTTISATNAPLTNELLTQIETIESLQQKLETRTKLDADVAAAKADVAEMEALNKTVADAKAVLEDSEEDGGFGVTLTEFAVGGTATAENDLFVFSTDADGASVAQFGAAGEDKIYIGDSFTRVDLASDAVFSKEQGDASTLEVFFQQDGNNAVLTFEDKAFAGSGSSTTEDLTEITLTGVNIEDLSINNGFITVA